MKSRRSSLSYRTEQLSLVKLSSSLQLSPIQFTKSLPSPFFRTTLSSRPFLLRKRTPTNTFLNTSSPLLLSTTSSLRLLRSSKTKLRLMEPNQRPWSSSLPLERLVSLVLSSNELVFKHTDKRFSKSTRGRVKVNEMPLLKPSKMRREVYSSRVMLLLEEWISVRLFLVILPRFSVVLAHQISPSSSANVTAVIQVGIPQTPEQYVHR